MALKIPNSYQSISLRNKDLHNRKKKILTCNPIKAFPPLRDVSLLQNSERLENGKHKNLVKEKSQRQSSNTKIQ